MLRDKLKENVLVLLGLYLRVRFHASLTHFLIKSFSQGLVLKRRQKATQNWPFGFTFLLSTFLVLCLTIPPFISSRYLGLMKGSVLLLFTRNLCGTVTFLHGHFKHVFSILLTCLCLCGFYLQLYLSSSLHYTENLGHHPGLNQLLLGGVKTQHILKNLLNHGNILHSKH